MYHKYSLVDSKSGFHTQSIERAYVEVKSGVKKALGGKKLLASHLREISCRKIGYKNSVDIYAAL